MRVSLLLPALLLLAACTPSTPKRPPVVVAIVVDQFAAWVAKERLPLLPATGGFARLLREGTYVEDVRFAHAVTSTAPGHAALHTGATPSVSGIYANDLVDARDGSRSSILRDDGVRQVDPAGATEQPSSSPRALRAPTLADALKGAHPSSVVLALSVKDRGAIIPGGRRPDLALWFDPASLHFVTSTAFSTSLPRWLPQRLTPDSVTARVRAGWQLSSTTTAMRRAAGEIAGADDETNEAPRSGDTRTAPRALGAAMRPGDGFRASPQGDEAVVELALAAVDAERKPRAPLFLSISLSSTDYIGHHFGPDSDEAWENLLRLDQTLARLFEGLDQRLGPDYAVLLSGDHGIAGTHARAPRQPECSADAPDRWERPCRSLESVLRDDLASQLETVADRELGPGDWVAGIADPYVTFSAAAHELPLEQRQRVEQRLVDALRARPEVAYAIALRERAARCPPETDDSLPALVCRSFPQDALGDLYVVLGPGRQLATRRDSNGANHGSPYAYDRSVPLIVRAPGRVAAGRVISGPLSFATFTQTAAALLDIAPPADALPATPLTRLAPAR